MDKISKETDGEQLAQSVAEAMAKLPPQARYGFLQQIKGAALLAQMMQEQKPA